MTDLLLGQGFRFKLSNVYDAVIGVCTFSSFSRNVLLGGCYCGRVSYDRAVSSYALQRCCFFSNIINGF